jgi:amyloid beta precursor protein binding protein 1
MTLDDKFLKEICRYSDSKLHTIAAYLGGVASQEAIKMLIKQYTPFNHTLVYDGIHGRAQVFEI